MAKNKQRNPLTAQGGARRINKAPTMSSTSSTSTIIRYSAIGGNGTPVDEGGRVHYSRVYVPGYSQPIGPSAGGPDIVAHYDTAKFLPGTTVKWLPNVGTTTPGRLFVAFTDNPEVMYGYQNLVDSADKAVFIKGFGNVVTFPVWLEREMAVPTFLRRKRFDCNKAITAFDVDKLDRCAQVMMMAVAEADSPNPGSFTYHDVVAAEGVKSVTT